MDRYDFMSQALTLAKEAALAGEIPVGCVIVKNGNIIAQGRNESVQHDDSTMHAEMIAIKNASKTLNCANLSGCELYVTLEPCLMCAGAIINSKISKVVFGAFDLNYGACGSVTNLFSLPNIHRPECYGGIMEDDCSEVLSDFFKKLRKTKENLI